MERFNMSGENRFFSWYTLNQIVIGVILLFIGSAMTYYLTKDENDPQEVKVINAKDLKDTLKVEYPKLEGNDDKGEPKNEKLIEVRYIYGAPKTPEQSGKAAELITTPKETETQVDNVTGLTDEERTKEKASILQHFEENDRSTVLRRLVDFTSRDNWLDNIADSWMDRQTFRSHEPVYIHVNFKKRAIIQKVSGLSVMIIKFHGMAGITYQSEDYIVKSENGVIEIPSLDEPGYYLVKVGTFMKKDLGLSKPDFYCKDFKIVVE